MFPHRRQPSLALRPIGSTNTRPPPARKSAASRSSPASASCLAKSSIVSSKPAGASRWMAIDARANSLSNRSTCKLLVSATPTINRSASIDRALTSFAFFGFASLSVRYASSIFRCRKKSRTAGVTTAFRRTVNRRTPSSFADSSAIADRLTTARVDVHFDRRSFDLRFRFRFRHPEFQSRSIAPASHRRPATLGCPRRRWK